MMKHYPLHVLRTGYFFLTVLIAEIKLSAGVVSPEACLFVHGRLLSHSVFTFLFNGILVCSWGPFLFLSHDDASENSVDTHH